MPKIIELTDPIDFDNICPIIYALSFIGQKWKIPIMWHLADEGTLRYNKLKRDLPGITNIMLTKSLRELEEHGLVQRTQYDEVPPRVEYSLTPRGGTLIPLLKDFDAWGRQQIQIDRSAAAQTENDTEDCAFRQITSR